MISVVGYNTLWEIYKLYNYILIHGAPDPYNRLLDSCPFKITKPFQSRWLPSKKMSPEFESYCFSTFRYRFWEEFSRVSCFGDSLKFRLNPRYLGVHRVNLNFKLIPLKMLLDSEASKQRSSAIRIDEFD